MIKKDHNKYLLLNKKITIINQTLINKKNIFIKIDFQNYVLFLALLFFFFNKFLNFWLKKYIFIIT